MERDVEINTNLGVSLLDDNMCPLQNQLYNVENVRVRLRGGYDVLEGYLLPPVPGQRSERLHRFVQRPFSSPCGFI